MLEILKQVLTKLIEKYPKNSIWKIYHKKQLRKTTNCD